jgi:hypothetical protein
VTENYVVYDPLSRNEVAWFDFEDAAVAYVIDSGLEDRLVIEVGGVGVDWTVMEVMV